AWTFSKSTAASVTVTATSLHSTGPIIGLRTRVHIRETTEPKWVTRGVMGGGVRRSAVVVGRETELEALRGALAAARAGSSCGAFLLGEAGIGKTRLLAEIGSNARRLGLAVLDGRASSASPTA